MTSTASGTGSSAGTVNTVTMEAQALRISVSDAQAMVPLYDGRSEELHRFITCCDSLLNVAKNETDKNLFFDIIKTRLTGPAYDILKYKVISGWTEMKRELLAQFQEERPRASIQSELLRVKQGTRESVKDFAHRVTKLLSELNNSTLSESTDTATKQYLIRENETNAVKVFEDGLLNEHLKLLAKASKESSLRKLVVYILEHSLRVNENNFASRPAIPAAHNFTDFCNFCKKPGHKQDNCFQKKKLPQFPPQISVPIKRELNQVICSYCRKPNHHIRDCRSRLRNEQARQLDDSTNRPKPFRHVRWAKSQNSKNAITREEELVPSSRIIQTQAEIHTPPDTLNSNFL